MSTTYEPTPYRSGRAHISARLSVWGVVRYTLLAIGTLSLIHVTAVWFSPNDTYTVTNKYAWPALPQILDNSDADANDDSRWTEVHEEGGFRRDPYPLRTILSFWDLAEKEVEARGANTCDGQLGRQFIDAYHETDFAYCTPGGHALNSDATAAAREAAHGPKTNQSSTIITCSAIQRHSFTKWWPYPAAPCLSTNLRLIKGERKAFHAVGCDATSDGARLDTEMDKEDFLGLRISRLDPSDPDANCTERINHTTILIGRQDQWNP